MAGSPCDTPRPQLRSAPMLYFILLLSLLVVVARVQKQKTDLDLSRRQNGNNSTCGSSIPAFHIYVCICISGVSLHTPKVFMLLSA